MRDWSNSPTKRTRRKPRWSISSGRADVSAFNFVISEIMRTKSASESVRFSSAFSVTGARSAHSGGDDRPCRGRSARPRRAIERSSLRSPASRGRRRACGDGFLCNPPQSTSPRRARASPLSQKARVGSSRNVSQPARLPPPKTVRSWVMGNLRFRSIFTKIAPSASESNSIHTPRRGIILAPKTACHG